MSNNYFSELSKDSSTDNLSHLQAELASDLHWALARVPISANYYDKLDFYAAELIENYHWSKIYEYSSIEQLELLPVGSRIITATNYMAIKKAIGWALITEQGYIMTNVPTDNLSLPAFSVQTQNPRKRHQSET